jgi:rhamnulokinase
VTPPLAFAAADLGASSGRVILGTLANGRFHLDEVYRFPNGPLERDGSMRWDAEQLFSHIRAGFNVALRKSGGLASIGIDTWGVDYGCLDSSGALLGNPYHYRDSRTSGVPEKLFASMGAVELYAQSGLQVMPYNTIFQMIAEQRPWADVSSVLMMPDLFNYLLSGMRVSEVTVASTTGLLDVSTRAWSERTCGHLSAVYGVPVPRILPDLAEPGTRLGNSLPGLLDAQVPVVAVASHDTASAVVSVPASGSHFAFVSSGTWSLVGLELPQPVLGKESRAGNFTNELGLDGTVRYLKNVMGLWVLSEAIRSWETAGLDVDLVALIEQAIARPALACVLDMSDDRLIPPGDMPARLRRLATESDQVLDPDPATVTRCILDSLATAYRTTIHRACELANREVHAVHIVGGGSQNRLLCQLTADATGLPVVAGPVEGAALGNLLVQARAADALRGDLTQLRRVVAESCESVTYLPGVLVAADRWEAAERRLTMANVH